MPREALPQRRPNRTLELEHGGLLFTVTVGYDPVSGVPMEVFGSCGKVGSDFSALLADACVLVSLALQFGAPAALLAGAVGYVPVVGDYDPAGVTMGVDDKPMTPASVIGTVLRVLL